MSQPFPSHQLPADASLCTIQNEVFLTECRLEALSFLVYAMLTEEEDDSDTPRVLGVVALFQDVIASLQDIRSHLEHFE